MILIILMTSLLLSTALHSRFSLPSSCSTLSQNPILQHELVYTAIRLGGWSKVPQHDGIQPHKQYRPSVLREQEREKDERNEPQQSE